MNIHEYQAKEILRCEGIPIPEGRLVLSGPEASKYMMELNHTPAVLKAQVQTGGRGKAGGVKLVDSPQMAEKLAETMLGMKLVTHQTGPTGKIVRKLYLEAAMAIKKEYYLAITIDRKTANIGIMFSQKGGMDIEEVAQEDPDSIKIVHVDPTVGLMGYHLRKILSGTDLPQQETKQLSQIITKLYQVFTKLDCSLVEINPLVVNDKGEMYALDGKMNFDDNALYRHDELPPLRDFEEEDPREVNAAKYGLSYIGLDGNIACLVNGAGLAMATMDIIKHYGGEPANFLDVGGGATLEAVRGAFGIIAMDKNVKGIFVNIFGGIMKCDVIASGIVAALKEAPIKVPLVVRLEGTNVEKGQRILTDAAIKLISVDDLASGAKKIVELTKSN